MKKAKHQSKQIKKPEEQKPAVQKKFSSAGTLNKESREKDLKQLTQSFDASIENSIKILTEIKRLVKEKFAVLQSISPEDETVRDNMVVSLYEEFGGLVKFEKHLQGSTQYFKEFDEKLQTELETYRKIKKAPEIQKEEKTSNTYEDLFSELAANSRNTLPEDLRIATKEINNLVRLPASTHSRIEQPQSSKTPSKILPAEKTPPSRSGIGYNKAP